MSDALAIFKDYLHQKGLRLTLQRRKVLEAFLEMKGHIGVEDLFQKIQRQDPSMGIATVYRTMNLLVEAGLARAHADLAGHTLYETAYQRGHHDHLVCLGCGRIEEFEHPLIEQLQVQVSQAHDFALHSHRMELYGFCGDCQG